MIINKTQHKTISEKEIICKSPLSQARGLMFHLRKNNLVMVFPEERRISLHNFFVFYPIDVLVLDSALKVVEIKKNFLPFTFWKAKKKGKYLIELSQTESPSYQVGDQINLI